MLALEKQTHGWKDYKTKDGITVGIQVFESGQILTRTTVEVPYPLVDFYYFLKENCTKIHQESCVAETVQVFNENLSVGTSKLKLSFPFSNRDFVYLKYTEILPEDNFALIGLMSIDRKDLPPTKEFIRGELVIGNMIRVKDEKSCTMTLVFHVDFKGQTKNTPAPLLKRQAAKMQSKKVKMLKQMFESNKIPRRVSLSASSS